VTLPVHERHPRAVDPHERAVRPRGTGGWEATALRYLEWVAYPALAGLAFCLLSLGVLTWLPALAALASALRRWRRDGDSRCFTGVLTAFPGFWRTLWRHALVSTAGLAALAVAIAFLAGRPEPVAIPLLAVQIGGLAAFVTYHLALAVVAAHDGAAGSPGQWRSRACAFAFGSAGRGFALLAAAVLAPVVALPLAVGPLLLGPSLAVLCGLILLERSELVGPG
jgi:hypothetical protein